MEDKGSPFNQLSPEDQRSAIDVGVCVAILGTRIPSCGKALFDYVATEFCASHNLPANIAKYALREVGRSLFTSDWSFEIAKSGSGVTTVFQRTGDDKPNGDTMQESSIIH